MDFYQTEKRYSPQRVSEDLPLDYIWSMECQRTFGKSLRRIPTYEQRLNDFDKELLKGMNIQEDSCAE